jgi:cytochrome c6
MKRTVLAFAVLAAFAVAGVARADAAAGELFQKKCAVCHGKDGKGTTPMAQKLGVKDLSQLKSSEAEIAKIIAEGKGKMTAFKGRMSDAEIQSVAAFVKAGLT